MVCGPFGGRSRKVPKGALRRCSFVNGRCNDTTGHLLSLRKRADHLLIASEGSNQDLGSMETFLSSNTSLLLLPLFYLRILLLAQSLSYAP